MDDSSWQVGVLPGVGSRPDLFLHDRVRTLVRPGAKNNHLKKSPPTALLPPSLPATQAQIRARPVSTYLI